MLRQDLVKAREYAAKLDDPEDKRPARDLKLETLAEVLARRVPLLVTAQKAQDIAGALRLRKEFGFRMILDGAAESYLLADAIRDAAVPVLVHPPMSRSFGELENASFETAAKLRDAGVTVAIESGFESYVPKTRVVLLEAAVAAANGLGPERALAAITIDAARILGADDRIGSIEAGKDGDLALYDGDPFEYTTHCVGTVIDGKLFEGRR
jgi:imidazolonepropionase-like amidohydrolase